MNIIQFWKLEEVEWFVQISGRSVFAWRVVGVV